MHNGKPEPQTWEEYADYSNYFGQIADTLETARTPESLRELKKIDNALYVFGQFLAGYYKR